MPQSNSIFFHNYFLCLFCTQMVKLLLDNNAKMNALDKKERQALHWAAYMGHIDVVMILVERGADISCTDKQVRDLL